MMITGCATSRRPSKAVPPPTRLQTDLAVDKDGSTVLAGTFAETAQIGGATVVSAGGTDFFVVRTNPQGTGAVWSQRFGGPQNDTATSVAIDPDGQIVIAGTFQGKLTFGAETLAPQFRSPEMRAIFVAKMDVTGKPLWIRQIAMTDAATQVSVAIRPDKSIIVGAGVFGTIQKDGKPTMLAGESLTIAALSPAGQPVPPPGLQLLSGPPLSVACEHSPCGVGGRLNQFCDWCPGTICAVDPYCCDVYWDAICVSEVATVCGQRCDCGDLCKEGNPYNMYACAPCTNIVCSVDPYCCRVAWDSICVSELALNCDHKCK